MPRYLMTHSLLSSWLYAMKENPYEDATTERDPLADFLKVLNREPTPTTDAMQKGIDFEDLVTAITENESCFGFYEAYVDGSLGGLVPADIQEHKWYGAAKIIADKVKGGVRQYAAKKEIRIHGLTLLLYGRLDWLKAGEIVDIKFSSGYDKGKYFDSTQHPMYFELVPEAEIFTYQVSNGTNVWTESYMRDETRSIFPVIANFLSWLKTAGYMDVYKEKWLAL